jgi:hypothetical protein
MEKGNMSTMRTYNLFVRYPDGRLRKLTLTPMSHAECCVMKSKFSESGRRPVFN